MIEYDSDTHHLKGWRRARDNDKREALRTMGYRVVEVSTQQFDSLVMVDDSCCACATIWAFATGPASPATIGSSGALTCGGVSTGWTSGGSSGRPRAGAAPVLRRAQSWEA